MIIEKPDLEYLLLSLFVVIVTAVCFWFMSERYRKKFISIDEKIHAFLCRLLFIAFFSWLFAAFLNIFFGFYDLKIDIYQFFPSLKILSVGMALQIYLGIISTIKFGYMDSYKVIPELQDWIIAFFVKDKE